jgi:hypothetical protein
MRLILIFEIVLMIVIILFPYDLFIFSDSGIIINATRNLQKKQIDLFLMLTCIYIFIKSTIGIIIMRYKFKNKDYMLHPKKYILLLLPTILLTLHYNRLIILYFLSDIFYNIFGNKYYSYIGLMDIIDIGLSVLFAIGFSMWLIYWTFYEENIKKNLLIPYHIITFICIFKLATEITILYMQ